MGRRKKEQEQEPGTKNMKQDTSNKKQGTRNKEQNQNFLTVFKGSVYFLSLTIPTHALYLIVISSTFLTFPILLIYSV